ncbi:MAG: type II toxin-antitoxin system RelE/ParE family toxin [Brevundimonas sp.]|nr:type II toxin-antitoxin system RelE/ParE family toxin [Brevundimonas sp.]
MAEYRLSPAAQRDLEAIFDYTVAEWGLQQAVRYIDLIEAACTALAETPMAAAACDHIRLGYRRRRVQRHVIYARPEPYGAAIIRILHDSMDAEHHL